MMKKIFIITFILLTVFSLSFSHISDVVFDDTQVLEFSLTFEQINYVELLWTNYLAGENEYIPATFEFNGEVYPNVGVRYKGNASCFSYPNDKKPFKIKFDEYDEEQEFHGITKLSLSNQFYDPSFLREKFLFDVFNKYVSSSRANFIKLYTNGEYLGLYTNVEQVDSRYVKRIFGDDEAGNLFKGDPNGTLEWLGPEPENYYLLYELKTNEELNDWSDLINLIDVLNNTPLEEFPDAFENVFHMYGWICTHAINNIFVNLDSYVGKGHNYYMYHRTDSDKFIHFPWDLNLSFATYSSGIMGNDAELTIYYAGDSPGTRPLAEIIHAIDEYLEIYLMIYKYIYEHELDPEVIYPRIHELADMIRPAVYADENKMFTNEQFEASLYEDIGSIYGLESFVEQRRNSLNTQFEGLTVLPRIENIFINEFMANNDSFYADEFGEFDDWIEIYNANEEPVDISGLYLSDNPVYQDKWKFPENTVINNGEYLIVWLDNEPEQGDLHTNFRLNESGEFIGLYCKDSILPIDSLSFGNQFSDVSSGRYPDGVGDWEFMLTPTPGTTNIPNNYPPALSNYQQNPLTPLSSDDVNVIITATDDNFINSVILYYDNGTSNIYIYMLDDGLNNDGVAGDDIYGCYIPQHVSGTNIQYYIEAEDNQSVISRFPENDDLVEYEVDYSCPKLFINEFLALNSSINQDPQGEYDDWVEIYNAGEEAVDIGGMYITDNLNNYSRWYKIPETHPDSTTIQPGDFLLLWADEDEEDGILHLGFRLLGDNEDIGLFAFYCTTPIDTLSYGLQSIDNSYGRYPDGSQNWDYFVVPTPGYSNTGLEPPDNVIIYFDNGNINIEWDSVNGATSYSVYSSSTPYGDFTLEESGIVGTSWFEPVSSDRKFYYIKAVNE